MRPEENVMGSKPYPTEESLNSYAVESRALIDLYLQKFGAPRGWSTELAAKVGISSAHIGNIYRGRTNVGAAVYFNLKSVIEPLLGLEDEEGTEAPAIASPLKSPVPTVQKLAAVAPGNDVYQAMRDIDATIMPLTPKERESVLAWIAVRWNGGRQ